MAPTLVALGAAALALVGDVTATRFYLDETYDKTNFFDKWNFFESNYDSPDYNDVDPTSGYVNYRNRHDATQLGLIKQVGDDMYIGVNSREVTDFPGIGRDSVRIESQSIYNQGLMIARFSHLPKPVCGSWPAFWSFGDPWPKVGELDWYEGWNDGTINKPVIHTNHAAENGTCHITNAGQTSLVTHANCDTWAGVWANQGCTTETTHEDPYGSDEGGIYAVEWTDAAIKFYSWTWANRPANIDSDEPDTSTWGTPSVLIASPSCNVQNHFKNHKLVINITFCGKAAGNEGIWGQSCRAKTQKAECSAYVAENPEDFEDTYWQIKDIRHFGLTRPPATSTTEVASSSTADASSSAEPEASSTLSEAASAASSEAPASSTESDVSSTVSSEALPSSTDAVSASSIESEVSSTISGEASVSTEAASSAVSSDVVSSSALSSGALSESSAAPSAASSDISSAAPESSTAISSDTIPSSAAPSDVSSSEPIFIPSPTNWPPPSSAPPFGNSSATIPPYPLPSDVDKGPTTTYSTSTVFSTKVTTITSCPPYVPNCEDRVPQVVTDVVPIYTTVCPVVVSTKTIKRIRTVTSCPPSVPSTACPYGSKTTETFYSTITKVLDTPPTPTDGDYYGEWHGGDEDKPDRGKDYSGVYIPTMTKYVFHTATLVPVPPVHTPKPPKNITLPANDKPSYGHDVSYPVPDLEAGAVAKTISAGFILSFGAAVAIFAL